MALKDSVMGIVLASSVVATLITLAFDAFVVPRADQGKIDQSEKDHALRFAQIVNTVIRGEGFTNAVSRQDFMLTVLVPLYEDEPKYKPIILQLIALDGSVDAASAGNADDVAVTTIDAVRTPPDTITKLQEGRALPEEYSVDALREGFFSGYRRQLSDALVREIDNGRDDLPEQLIRALIDDPADPKSYRINLYVAYTLARVEKWSSSEASFAEFKALTKSPNYDDLTFRRRVDEALLQRVPL